MPLIFNLQRLITLSAALVVVMMASATVSANPIVITTGSPGNQNTDNVLFNNPALTHSGLVDFNGSGAGFIVDFTSTSGFSGPQTEFPEPASLLLLGGGLVGTAGALRRRLKNRSNK